MGERKQGRLPRSFSSQSCPLATAACSIQPCRRRALEDSEADPWRERSISVTDEAKSQRNKRNSNKRAAAASFFFLLFAHLLLLLLLLLLLVLYFLFLSLFFTSLLLSPQVPTKEVSLDAGDAVAAVLATSSAKFTETVEFHAR